MCSMPPRFSKPSHFTADSQTVIIRGPGLALTRRPPAGSPHSCTISEDSVCGLEVDMTVQVVEGLADATISQVEYKHYGIRSSAGISEPQTTHCCRVTRHSARAFKFGPHPGRDWAVTKPVLPVSCQKPRYNNSGRGVLEILKRRPSFLRTLAVCVLEFLVDHCPRTWTLASLAALRTHSIACVPCGSLSPDVDPREPCLTRSILLYCPLCAPCSLRLRTLPLRPRPA